MDLLQGGHACVESIDGHSHSHHDALHVSGARICSDDIDGHSHAHDHARDGGEEEEDVRDDDLRGLGGTASAGKEDDFRLEEMDIVEPHKGATGNPNAALLQSQDAATNIHHLLHHLHNYNQVSRRS